MLAATTRTEYTHDTLFRTTGVSQDGAAVDYAYNGSDLLSTLTSASDTAYTFTYGAFDRLASVTAGNHALITNTYTADRSRRLSQSTYGNGDSLSYGYDSFGRVISRTWEDGDTVAYTYDTNGNVGKITDSGTGRTVKNAYDFLDRLMRYDETGTGYSNSVRWSYDVKNRLTSQTQILNGSTYTTGYTYDDDNRVTGMTQGDISAEYTYDALGRMTGVADKAGTSTVVDTAMGYRALADNKTTTQITSFANTAGGDTAAYAYAYDARGNITSVSDGTYTTTYVYDGKDQLLRENNEAADKTWVYTYDDGGNILSKTEYAYTTGDLGTPLDTITYTYGDSTWKDLLTAYDGQTLTCDEIGNLTGDGTWEYTWQHGRQLAGMTDGTTAISYAYNADGRRIFKTVDSVTYNYVYVGSTLTDMTWGSNAMHFVYDALGAAAVVYNGTTYYYLRNAQGDIVDIVDTAGNTVVSYTYDAWGNILSTTGTMATTLGADNPLRYRGYFYDTETGLYYLMSRYYNPTWGRFINADTTAVLTASLDKANWDKNLFAYCDNNPVSRKDDGGKIWNIIIGAVVGGTIAAVTTYMQGGDWKACLIAGAVGAASGAIAATGLGFIAQAGLTAATAAVGDVLTQTIVEHKRLGELNVKRTVQNTAVAAGCSIIGSALGSLTSYSTASQGKALISTARDKLLTGQIRREIGQSASSLLKQGNKILAAGKVLVNTARGISSVTGTLSTWGISVKYCVR